MKKTITLLSIAVAMSASAKNETYQTTGNGTVYTLADLAKIEESGVEKVNDNTYRLTKDVQLGEEKNPDGFKLEDNTIVLMGHQVLVRVYGPAEFAVTDTATIRPNADGDKPKGFHLYEMKNDARTIAHVRFEGAGLNLGNDYGTVVENCTFTGSNGELSKYAVCFSAASINNAVRNCHFVETGFSAVGNGSNVAAGMTIENNLLENCSTQGRNYPYLNIVPSGNNGGTIIRNNRIVGAGGLMAGAISVSNMLTMTGENKVLIENNEMSDCRYGMNIYGYQDARIINNKIVNCHYEKNANNGGSGITVYGKAGSEYIPTAYIQGNYIDGCLWGVTVVGGANVNLGRTNTSSARYNPGGNVFKNNGNCGTAPAGQTTAYDPSIPYDLYNNTTSPIFAQGNTWGGADQSPEEIEKRIFHVKDNANLGEVFYMDDASGINDIDSDDATAVETRYYSISGQRIGQPTPGDLYIEVSTMSDGTVRTAKRR